MGQFYFLSCLLSLISTFTSSLLCYRLNPHAALDPFYVHHLHIALLSTRVADSALFIGFSDISNTQQRLKNRLASAFLSVNKAIVISITWEF